MTLINAVLEELTGIVGEENILKDEIDLLCYSRDCTPYLCKPDVVVFPKTTDEVSKILRLANKEKIPVTPRGAGASVTGSSLPRNGGILLDSSKMNKIKEVSPENFYVALEPGVLLRDLNQILSQYGLIFPHDVGTADVSSIGGMIAANSHGHHGCKHGYVRDWVLGLEIVLPNGDIIRTGSKVLRSNCGYDLTRLFVGSFGTLGVITEAMLRVTALPKYKVTIAAFFEKLEHANKAIINMLSSGTDPSAIEMVNRFVLETANNEFQLGFPTADAMLIVDLDGYDSPSVESRVKEVVDICIKEKSKKVSWSDNPSEIEKFWKPRLYVDLAVSRCTKNKTNIGCLAATDPCVPLSKMAYIIKAMEKIYRQYGLITGIIVHAGVGIIHPYVYIDVECGEEWKRAKTAEKEVIHLITSAGGSITGEHGVGIVKVPFVKLELGKSLDLMKRIKAILDPNNIMNPGKMALDLDIRDIYGQFAYSAYCSDQEMHGNK